MKTLKSVLIASFLAFAINTTVFAKSKTYSHLPLNLSEYLKDELRNPNQKIEKALFGNIYLDFYVDENCQIQIVGLSSNSLELGAFVKTELENLPELTINCPKGVIYTVKVRLSYH